jgi:CRP/FNR family transcriptional regulator
MTEAGNWLQHFPGLVQLPPALRDALVSRSTLSSIPAGSRIFGPGQAPQSFLLVLDGVVRVQQVSESGREIVLYRVSAGESCALTTACLLAYDDYLAEAIAETDIAAVAIPRATFDDLIAQSAEFRRFVFTAFSQRVTDLCRIIEDVAFARMDVRLAHKLLQLAEHTDHLTVTQAQLAAELGTAREVVSRLVGDLQRRGLVASHRGHLDIVDRAGLQVLATAR